MEMEISRNNPPPQQDHELASHIETTAEAGTSAEQTSDRNTGPYRYSQDSPVVEVPDDRLAQIAQAFQDSVSQYATDGEGHPVSASLAKYAAKAERWNERSEDAKTIASEIGQNLMRRYDPKTYTYDLGGGHSAGMMTLTHSSSETTVEYLATHPGASGAGKTMIEKAVNESQAKGNRGEVTLESLDDHSSEFYKSIGFQSQDGDEMTLKPSESELWTQQNGTWSLKENENKRYLRKAED